MANYFANFPKIDHDVYSNGTTIELVNIMTRFKFSLQSRNSVAAFYEYQIKDGDRPDIIAEKYYGNSHYAWIVLLFNNIHDPLFGWPLFGVNFDNFIEKKYGSIYEANTTIHEYRQILNSARTLYTGTVIPKKTVAVDLTTYNTLASNARETITKYEYESELNEAKRNIKILDKKYLNTVKEEFKNLLKNG